MAGLKTTFDQVLEERFPEIFFLVGWLFFSTRKKMQWANPAITFNPLTQVCLLNYYFLVQKLCQSSETQQQLSLLRWIAKQSISLCTVKGTCQVILWRYSTHLVKSQHLSVHRDESIHRGCIVGLTPICDSGNKPVQNVMEVFLLKILTLLTSSFYSFGKHTDVLSSPTALAGYYFSEKNGVLLYCC